MLVPWTVKIRNGEKEKSSCLKKFINPHPNPLPKGEGDQRDILLLT